MSATTLLATGGRIDHVRALLARADVEELGPRRDHAASAKAQSYVLLAAALEYYVRETLTGVLNDIAARTMPLGQLKVSILTMVSAPSFDALTQVSGLKKWRRRMEALSSVLDPAPFRGASGSLPLDGRTLRAQHFQLVWEVFGFPNQPLPGALHALALMDLAEGRNSVAHGRVDPLTFGRGKALLDVRRLADLVEEIVVHMEYAIDAYLGGSLYMR